jgi:hypothetical protein
MALAASYRVSSKDIDENGREIGQCLSVLIVA